MSNEMTIGELARRLDAMEKRIEMQFSNVNRHIETLQYVNRDSYLVQMQALTDRLTKLEDAKTWLSRAVVVSILFPIIVALLVLVISRG